MAELTPLFVVSAVAGLLLLLFILTLVLFRCKEEAIFYRPRKHQPAQKESAVSPGAYLTENGTELEKCGQTGARVSVQYESVKTSDGLTLRGVRFVFHGADEQPNDAADSERAPAKIGKKRMVHYLHGARVFLPQKSSFFHKMCLEL